MNDVARNLRNRVEALSKRVHRLTQENDALRFENEAMRNVLHSQAAVVNERNNYDDSTV